MIEREKRRFERVTLKEKNKATVVSIGSEIQYNMHTRNVSNKGLFLEYGSPKKLPFTVSSVLEIWLDIGEEARIFFNGKVVRTVLPEDNQASLWGPGVAIKIIQITDEQNSKLEEFIQKNAKD